MSVCALLGASPAAAQSFLGEVRLTAASFCNNDSMETAGQTLSIAQNNALFALIGCTYG
ncbi:MAG: tail fiber protein, partial [Oceanicaulis sp.]